AEADHVDGARVPRDVLALHPALIESERARRRELTSAADVVPSAGNRRQDRDRSDGRSAAGVTLQTVVETDERRSRRAVAPRKTLDCVDRQAADRGDLLRRVIAQH